MKQILKYAGTYYTGKALGEDALDGSKKLVEGSYLLLILTRIE